MNRKMWILFLLLLVLFVGAGGICFMNSRWIGRIEALSLAESTEELETKEQGFYFIHGFVLKDVMDCHSLVSESYSWDRDTKLSLVEINLCEYNRTSISEKALKNARLLFDELRKENRHLILRVVYDWDGKNMETEPTRRSLVETHMRQMGPVINENKDIIYTLQGLFVGNWGEMNGTRYTGTEDWQALFRTLAGVTDDDIFLAVRMPMQWRRCTGTDELTLGTVSARLGLFNDGMMGSESDLGTYGEKRREDASIEDIWCREDELAFQDELCRFVPNGGEVVYDTEFNNFPAAVETLGRMHVSYLNLDYDRAALNKWQSFTVRDGSVWDGMDGLTYIGRHLGWRLTADCVRFEYAFFRNELTLTVSVRNVGFAPPYRELFAEAVYVGANGEAVFPLEGSLQTICNGESAELTGTISLSSLKRGNYEVYLRVKDGNGKFQPLAVREAGALGVPIGRILAK